VGGGGYIAMSGKGGTKDPGVATNPGITSPAPKPPDTPNTAGTTKTAANPNPGGTKSPGNTKSPNNPPPTVDNKAELDRLEVLATTDNNAAANRQAQQGIDDLLPKLKTPADVLRGKYIQGLALYNSAQVVTEEVKRGCGVWKSIRTAAKGHEFSAAIEAAFEAGSCKGL
jgi:hypothetical protein